MAGVTTGGGTRIAFRTAGDPQGPPIVFVHGWAASSAAWAGQLSDHSLSAHRLVAVDLRGHGASDIAADGYDDPAVWAGDLAAVLDHLGRPAVLVGWSYGGLVVTDYLRERGTAGVAGVVYVGALTEMGRDRPGGAVGSAWDGIMRPALSEDPREAIPALTTLAERMTAAPLPGPDLQRHVGDMLRVPPRVRKALFRRDVGSAEVLAAIDVPVLIAHGTADTVVAPASAEYAAGKISTAIVRWFEEVGHMPFVERRAEFNAALVDFAGPVANH
ncbi:alpha/beta fold hydrolase [Actinophytocola algeriensis]|jgi:non-heme chloroperoxidase|uniref:Pimeloyl-ACP methyl ester carboxylesterase n=1 Tax=Actinophytocola algeriensis TaxID=1768010 RepID=A0A7W7VIU0_9PSEU|nr:alpha/beta hydrolase [Actinophytocola algeriensis]MBB4911803.1 pimeloyl-ACP methyl ester carboxylesterase [Actinophytocola algeriensis]MBE1477705.1 pimeloyl-ACP methyl ester carboxylesterase [Actinophytocola algeriensis]